MPDPMNYRHAFHAGNFADVFKHTVLIGLLEALAAKPAAYCYVDTHAGRGRYALDDAAARRTGEHEAGIGRLLDAPALPEALRNYVALVRAFAGTDEQPLARYPGSPLLAAQLLREQDRAIVCELQAEEAQALRTALHGDRRFAVHQRDGYEALKALLPPVQKRGLVLVDPPFEAQGGEFARIQAALQHALGRWSNAILAVWYPIKHAQTTVPFQRWLGNCGRPAIVAELLLHPANSPLRLNGCGMAIINPPWRFAQAIEAWLPTLVTLLAETGQGSQRLLRLGDT